MIWNMIDIGSQMGNGVESLDPDADKYDDAEKDPMLGTSYITILRPNSTLVFFDERFVWQCF